MLFAGLIAAATLPLAATIASAQDRHFQAEAPEFNRFVNGSFDDGPIGLGYTEFPGWEVVAVPGR